MKIERLRVIVRGVQERWTKRMWALERELRLIAAFAPTPSQLQHEIDLQASLISRTHERDYSPADPPAE